jgi:hypothetical protein
MYTTFSSRSSLALALNAYLLDGKKPEKEKKKVEEHIRVLLS